MDLESFKNIIYTKDISQIQLSDLKDLLKEYPYFDILHFIELIYTKQNEAQKFNNLLPSSAIFFSDKKRLYQLLNTDLRDKLILEHGHENNTFLEDPESDELIDDADTRALLDFSYVKSEKNNVSENEHVKDQSGEENSGEPAHPEPEISLIDRFLIEDPGPIRADKKTTLSGDVSKASAMESENLLTDTLAKIYVKQGLYNKAIYAYEKLSLKYPEKSVYFASQIKEITEIINKK